VFEERGLKEMGSKDSETAQTKRRDVTGENLGLPDAELFRTCFGRFPDPVIVADRQGNVLFLNEIAETLTGFKLTDEEGLVCSDILHSAHDDAPTPIEECLKLGTLDGFQIELKSSSGGWRPFFLSSQLVKDSRGNPAGCIFILRSVSSAVMGLRDMVRDSMFASVIDNFPMPFFTVDTNMTINYMNEHFEKLTGYSSAEVVNRMRCADVLRSSYCNTEDCLLRQAMEKRTPATGIRRVVYDREGREVPVAVHCSMITDSENTVIGGFKALRDITPLVEADQKIRMLVEITQEGILMVDENERVIYVNSKMAQILGHPKDDLVGKGAVSILPPQIWNMARDLARKIHQEHFREVSFCTTVHPGLTPYREDLVFETSIVVAGLGKGFITCLYFQDLTKHIEIERELFKANSFLGNIIKSSADGIVVADMQGNILIYNDAAERVLGYGADEVIGTPGALAKIASPELAKDNMRRMRSGEHGPPGTLTSTRITLVRKDGEEVPVRFSAAIIKQNNNEIGTVGIFSDLREQLRMRRELEEARMQVMQADKIASIGTLAAGIAHEINNPLSGILIFAELLHKDVASYKSQWGEDLQEIISQCMRCKEIVARLLEFSRQSVNQKFAYDVNSIVRRSVDLLSHQGLFQNIEFVIDLQADIPQMTGDPGQLQQVFINFIINAGTAMNGRGKIVITSRFDPVSEHTILQFADTGPGIAPDIMAKIFEPFFTTKGPGDGTGLGLSVAYGIIQQHGGHISVANAASSGAVFSVILPLESPEKAIEFYY
jgi:PAS domain S-box-containing protein